MQVLKRQAANRVNELRSSRLVLAGWQDVKTRATSTHFDEASISVKDTNRIYHKLEQRLSASMIAIYTDEDVAGVKNVDQESVDEAHQMIDDLRKAKDQTTSVMALAKLVQRTNRQGQWEHIWQRPPSYVYIYTHIMHRFSGRNDLNKTNNL